jgi:hypothetical protein
VLFLFIAVVLEDATQIAVVSNVNALAVPVDGLEFLHERLNGASHVLRFGFQLFVRCVPCDGHSV